GVLRLHHSRAGAHRRAPDRAPSAGLGPVPCIGGADQQVRAADRVARAPRHGARHRASRRAAHRPQPRLAALSPRIRLPTALMGRDARRTRPGHSQEGSMIFKNKTVLITGGTGSMGSTLVRRALSGEVGTPKKVVVFSRDEAKQHEMRMSYLHRREATDEVI